MTYWTWDSSLSVGIDIIDKQHQRIVDYINDLYAAQQSGDRDKVSSVLAGLIDYTTTHFVFEEDLMKRSGYPLFDLHKKVHDDFVTRVNRYVEDHKRGRDVTRKLMSELQIWLTNHIKKEDKDYSPYGKKVLQGSWLNKALNQFIGK